MDTHINSSAERFLNLIKTSRMGKLKIYVGMAAGVGKTYRMLAEAKDLYQRGVDVFLGYIETHSRKDTEKMTIDLPAISRRTVFYKGKALFEMDVEAIILQRPEVVIIDELAHTNIPGSKNEKRWQDVREVLEHGINVITAVNIQHIESLNEQVEKITGIPIVERVPDSLFQIADEIVNVDLTIEELLERLRSGKIYDKQKVNTALTNFFMKEKLLLLRDLSIKEVSRYVEKKIRTEIANQQHYDVQVIVSIITTGHELAKRVIHRSSRLVSSTRAKWFVVNLRTRFESMEKIDPYEQRMLMNNLKLASELGADAAAYTGEPVAEFIRKQGASLIVIGIPNFKRTGIWEKFEFYRLINKLEKLHIDLLLVKNNENNKK